MCMQCICGKREQANIKHAHARTHMHHMELYILTKAYGHVSCLNFLPACHVQIAHCCSQGRAYKLMVCEFLKMYCLSVFAAMALPLPEDSNSRGRFAYKRNDLLLS